MNYVLYGCIYIYIYELYGYIYIYINIYIYIYMISGGLTQAESYPKP